MREWIGVIAYVTVFLLLLAFVIYMRVAAPCNWIDWMPVAQIPARCLR